MKVVRTVLVLVAALAISNSLFAAEGKKREKKAPKAPVCPATQRVDKIVAGLTLTDEQKTKLDAVKKEFGPKMTEAMKQGEVLTPEQKKARDEAAKAAKAAGKKGKEVGEAVAAAVKLTDDQKAKQATARKQMGGLEKELRAKVMEVLTPEQRDTIKKARESKKGEKK